MCGIAGSVDAGADRRTIERQLDMLVHRGRDSRGAYEGRGAVIGQTRLAVIDLVTGDPPITNEDASVGAALNGEIYNYRELRDGLRRSGHELASRGDTEVIAHLAETLEPAALAGRLEGMFAFAVWDDRRRRLVLGRDRLGKKPLYYWSQGGRLVFGSEIKAVLAHPAVPRRLDADAIPPYLTFGYVPTPRTFYSGVQSLPPAHVLVAEGDGRVRIEPYWELPRAGRGRSAAREVSTAEAARAVRARLEAAVERRLVSDVPVGAFLSGGIDSSAVVGIMAGQSRRPVRTFTIGFEDEEGFDERPYARVVAERFGTEHVEFVVAPDAVELVERLVWHHDQPFGDSSAVPMYLLSELTRQHVTVALSGDGGDELFAGYERFSAALALARYGRVLRSPLGRIAASVPPCFLPRGAARVQRALAGAALGLPDAYLAWVSYVGTEERERLTGRAGNWGIDGYRRLWNASAGSLTLQRLLDLNVRTYLVDDLLPKVDRMAMAHALEVRSPFLDRDLVELAFRLPPAVKAGVASRKIALRRAVRDLLPPEILRRGKRGFGVPLDRWFRSDLRAYVEARLGSPRSRVRRRLNAGALDAMLAAHRTGRANHGHALWTLLTLEVFLEREDW